MKVPNGTSLRPIFSQGIVDANVREETRKLCESYLGGAWESVTTANIKIRVQFGGMNNFIFVVCLPDGLQPIGSEPSAVVLRIYFSEDLDDSLTETIVATCLTERSLGPALLGAFPEGRIEEFIPSRIVTNKEFYNIHVAYEVGKILARVHSLDVPITKKDRFMRMTEDMVVRLRRAPRWNKPHKMHTILVKNRKELYPEEISVDLLAEEMELTKRCLAKSGSPVVFSNNDLHEGNLLLRDGVQVTEHGIIGCPAGVDPLVLIDYEYASYTYRGFDFCHYCCECCQDNTNEKWPGYNIMEDQWPNEEHQRRFIQGYLDAADEVAKQHGGKRPHCVSDLPLDKEAAVQRLLTEIRQFVAFPQLMWGIWSFRQAEDFTTAPPQYDFFEYSFDRMALYYKWKPEMVKYLEN